MNNHGRDELQKLIKMREDGLLTMEEFSEAQRKLEGSFGDAKSSPGSSAQSVTIDTPKFNSQYGVAKGISQFQIFIGWVCVAAGLIAAISGFTSGGLDRAAGILSGVILVVGGLATVGIAQLTKAVVDNADYSREIFYLLHRQSKN